MDEKLDYIFGLIPAYLADNLRKAADRYTRVDELRFKRGNNLYLTVGENNIATDVMCTASEFECLLDRLCRGSLHSFGESIKAGYIPLGRGYRAGVCGKASTLTGTIDSVSNISSLCIRIPHSFPGAATRLYRILDNRSVLIYSPPSGGKTTVLRDIARLIAAPPNEKKVALIDSREEMDDDTLDLPLISLYSGYPKAAAIEIAARTGSPQYIICDELGTDDTKAIIGSMNCGVPIIASVHCDSFRKLMLRPHIKTLYDNNAFDLYVRLIRRKNEIEFVVEEERTGT